MHSNRRNQAKPSKEVAACSLVGDFRKWPFGRGSSPRLKIEPDAFVIPPSLVSQGKEINPAAIIARERRMQTFAALLTLGGALGLAFYYRDTLVRRAQ